MNYIAPSNNSRSLLLGAAVLLQLLSQQSVWSFVPAPVSHWLARQQQQQQLFMSEIPSDEESPYASMTPASEASLEQIKQDLVNCCTRSTKPSVDEVQRIVQELEEMAEQVSTIFFFNRTNGLPFQLQIACVE